MQIKPDISFNRNENAFTRSPLSLIFAGLNWGKTGIMLAMSFLAFGFMLTVSGCGSGGYPGGGITSLSNSSIVLDSGQSITITASISDSEQVSWALSQSGCGSQGCGTLSSATGTAVTYTAPAGVTTPETLTITASIPNTKSSQTAKVTVNPDPTITGTLPSGTVGATYSSTLKANGGTASLTMSLASGSLPPGLTFDASTGAVSGTPTAAGTYNFVVQAKDSSDVPDTVTVNESITIVTAVSPLSVTGGAQPAGVVGSPYSTALQATGGVTPYAWSISKGALPGGLTINPATGVISGTPTTAGPFSFTVQVKDATGNTATANASIAITSPIPVLVLTTTALPSGTVNVPYSATIGASGGTAPYSCSIASGTLPAGLTLNGCTVSGTPTTPGTSTVQVTVTDSSNPQQSATGPESITINPATLSLTTSALPNGQVNVPYTATIGVTGGTSPYSCAITSGTLPAGLTLSGCTVSGTPTTAGTSTVQVKVTDSGSPQQMTAGPESITISAGTLSLTTTALPNGQVNVPYTATIGVTGGTSPYSCSITSGTLPAGLTLSGCTVSGTPTTAGTSTVQVKVNDSGNPQQTASGPETITIGSAALSLTTAALPNGTVNVPYTATIGVTGGISPYSCSITSGTLPAGLTLSGCTVSGTPTTAGTANLQVKVTDASSPQQSTTGPESITISPAALSLSTTALPNGTVNVAYSATIGVTGGTSPYSCSITSGTLPAGLTLSGCTVSGTPTTAGTANLQVKVTDASSPQQSTTGPESITISPAALSLSTTALPNGTVNVAYSATIGVTGGTSPYSCSITSGTLPAGLTLSGCTVSGTPTTAGTSNLQVKVTDASSPQESTTGPESITIAPAQLKLTVATLPDGTVNVPYTATIGVTGGTSPYSCSITSGTLPKGLSLSGCTVSGTPSTAGASTVQVKVTDSGSPQQTANGPETITINAAALALTTSNLPDGTVNVPYSATIGVTGGISPYNCSITSGTLPAGLSLSGCTVSGTPSTAGTSTVQVKVTDSDNPQQSTAGPETIKINPAGALTLTGTLPNATVGVAYSQSLNATGGTKPYSFSVTSGSLPAGLTLSADGTVSGTPTTAGASTFTVTVTDSSSTVETATNFYTLLVTYPPGPNDGKLKGPYAFLVQGYDDVVSGVLSYQMSRVGAMTADGTGVIASGEQNSNHQSSTPTGTTVGTNQLLGTYQINSDNTGMITITTFNTDGTVNTTHTYAVSLKAPVSPATTYSQGSLIEYDNNQLTGTRGSGTLLAQTASDFATGLHGSYAFGLSGDTSCLVSCTVGIASGPVATVGEFSAAASGKTISGMADANIASNNFPNAPISGAYQSADADGQVKFTLSNTSINDGTYPVDYVAYIVNANELFVMSTDAHSAYSLLAGTAQEQTQTTFSALSGPIIGYENAQVNPSLVGVVLGNVLNYSSASIFRAVGNSSGSCNITNADNSGLTGLSNGLTSTLGNLLGLSGTQLGQGLLGAYDTTGTTTCPVASNGRGQLGYPQPPAGLLGGLLGGLVNTLFPSGPPSPRVFYLVAPNEGYFMQSDYAGLGFFEPQTGSPFTLASLNGTYVYNTLTAASLASTNATGTITFDGNGNANETLDQNVGVGNINLLQLGTTGSTTYTLSNPNGTDSAANTGRYLLGDGTTVVYAISPTRLVILNTSALQTAPTVSLAY